MVQKAAGRPIDRMALMGNVIGFTDGKHCANCDEQISPKRLQANPDARLCTNCQKDRAMAMVELVNQVNQCGRNRHSVQSRAAITIKWGWPTREFSPVSRYRHFHRTPRDADVVAACARRPSHV